MNVVAAMRGWGRVFAAATLFVLAAVGLRAQTTATDVVEAKARALIDALAKEDFATASAGFTVQMKAALPEDRLRTTWATLRNQAGAYKRQVAARTGESNGFRVVIITCEFEKATIDVQVVFDQALAVSGLRMSPGTPIPPPYGAPDYAKPDAYSEEDVMVGQLPGTLTIPVGIGPFPGVVLVHGSGPADRDETVGAEKPFKDLALGLEIGRAHV